VITIARLDRPPVACPAGNIVPSRFHRFGAGAVVGKKNHQRIPGDALFVQTVEDVAHAAIQVLDHCGIRSHPVCFPWFVADLDPSRHPWIPR